MLAQDLAARIEANPKAAAGGELQSWQVQASGRLHGLECTVTSLGGSPPAYRLELRWPLGEAEPGRLVIWTGR